MVKNSKGIVALVVILSLLVVGLGGYIIYDKALKEPEIIENNDNNDNDNINNNNANTPKWEYTKELIDNTGTVYNLNLNKLSPSKIEYEIVDSQKNTKLLSSEENWSADLKDFEVVIAQKIDGTDKEYKYYTIEYKDASLNAKLEIISVNVNTNKVNQILVINNNTKKIEYYVNLKGTIQYEPDEYNANPNQIAFRYAYGQNQKIDNYVDGFRPTFPYYFKKYGDKNILIFVKLVSDGFEITAIPGIEQEP